MTIVAMPPHCNIIQEDVESFHAAPPAGAAPTGHSGDGAPAPVLRANYAFRAVHLPPGDHSVVMRYTPTEWPVGLSVSAATLIATVGAGILQRHTERYHIAPAPAASGPTISAV